MEIQSHGYLSYLPGEDKDKEHISTQPKKESLGC